MVVTNLEEGAFSSEVGHIILTVQAVQNTLLDEIINIATEQGFRDVHFDFEFLLPEDREAYNTFFTYSKGPPLTSRTADFNSTCSKNKFRAGWTMV